MEQREWVRDDFGLRLRELTAVDGGADPAAHTFRAVGDDGTRYAVKWTSGGTTAGLTVAAALARVAPGTAPAPLPTVDGAAFSWRDGRRLSVTPWLGRGSALETAPTRDHWYAYGRLLRLTHDLPVTASIAENVPRETYAPRRRLTAFDTVDDAVRQRRAEPGDHLTGELRALWRGARDRLYAVREHVTVLAHHLRRQPSAPVVCHGDPHLGNVIVTTEAAVALIDWDDAVLAPRERDLMFVLGGGVLAFAPVTPRQRTWFLSGYGDPGIESVLDTDRLRYHRAERALEDVSDLAAIVLSSARTASHRAEALGLLAGVLSSTGLVEQVVG